jgi:hypothetical protein
VSKPERAEEQTGRAWRPAAFVFPAAAGGMLVRLAAAATAAIWFDEATAGLMGRGTLRGAFLLYFHGQAYMGAVDGYLHAVPFAFLGSSLDTLHLLPVVLSGLHVVLVAILARRIVGDGRWAALVALVPTPILLKFAHDARLFYSVVPACTLLLLLLGLGAVDRNATPARRTRALLVAGLVAGLAWWTNLIHTVPIAAVAGVTLLRRPRLHAAALAVPLAFVVGSAPFWIYAAVRGHVAPIRTPLAEPAAFPGQAELLLTTALPLLLGLPPQALAGAAGPALVAGSLIVLAAALGACLARGGAGGWLVVGVVALGSAAVVVAEHGRLLGGAEPLYLLPVVAVLPVALGVLLARLSRRSRLAAMALALALLGGQVAGLRAAYPQLFSNQEWQQRRRQTRWPLATVERLTSAGDTAVYTHDPDVLTFASAERITVSHLYQERYPPLASRVDAASRVAYHSANVPPGLDQSLAAAGIAWTARASPMGWPYYSDFRLEHDGHREIQPDGWSVSASHQSAVARHAVDRDARTHWEARAPRDAIVWVQIDLGAMHDVGMVQMLPRTFQEVPPGLRVELSPDGRDWALAREIPEYYGPLYWSGGHPVGRVRWGRVEVRFPPRRARYVRMTQLGAGARFAWTVREVFVYETGGQTSEAPVADLRPTLDALGRARARRLLADHAVAARIGLASRGVVATPSGNLHDLDGTMRPLGLLPAVPLGGDLAIAYAPGLPSAAAIEAALARAGWTFTREDAGGYRLLSRFAPRALGGVRLAREQWELAGSPGSGDARAAADGRAGTRWTTGRPQQPGDWVRVDLPAPTTLVGVDLELGTFTTDYPRGAAIEVAGDDGGWVRVAAEAVLLGPLVWAGTHVLRDGVERVALRFPPVRARAIRVVQTASDPIFDWSVAELHLLGS